MPLLNIDSEVSLPKELFDSGVEEIGNNPEKNNIKKEMVKKDIGNYNTEAILQSILGEAIKLNASDVHLTTGYSAKVRVNGLLFELATPILTENTMINFIKEILINRQDLLSMTILHDVDLAISSHGRRFRVNIFRHMGTYSIVMRLIPNIILSIEELGLPSIIKTFVNLPQGLVLVTGPTGSGKSTTIASILNIINHSQRKHIITLEDPIEFIYPKSFAQIEQREKNQDFLDWNLALKSILRQDPDVVLVGEMRDYETIASAITVAETGHLVFATLHTNSASQSIDRIIDVFPSDQQSQIRTQLSNVLSAVVSQRLIRPENNGNQRVPAYEILVANSAVKNNIREGQTHQIDSIIQTGSNVGMISMERSLANLYKSGIISKEIAMESTTKPKELELIIG